MCGAERGGDAVKGPGLVFDRTPQTPRRTPVAEAATPRTPRAGEKTPRARWRKAVAKVCAQKAVVEAFGPEPAWRQLRPYASLLTSGILFAPVSQAILTISVRATTVVPLAALPSSLQVLRNASRIAWWWPTVWWRGLASIFCKVWHPGGLKQFLKSSTLFAFHDVVTRGRTQWVEQATEAGAVRASQPLVRSIALEAAAGAIGARMSFEYMRCTIGGSGSVSCRVLGLGAAAGVARGLMCAYGGQRPRLQTFCSWSDFMIEVVAERESACLLGFACPLTHYVPAVLWGIANFLPWGLLIVPCNRVLLRFFGEDPICAQKAVLDRVALELEQSLRGQAELASARERIVAYIGEVELASLWQTVRQSRGARGLACVASGARELLRTASGSLMAPGDAAQKHLDIILARLIAQRAQDLTELLTSEGDGHVDQEAVAELLEEATVPVVLRRSDLVRSALAQLAERSVAHLLLGVTGRDDPRLETFTNYIGLRVQFVGEEGLDMGGVRKDFMDCFAAAVTRAEASPLALVEPLSILGLGADSTWRPAPCDEEHQSYVWALGRLLALALVYRCPCPIPLSLLVFKCVLGMRLRPGDVRQLDPDFWRHRVDPLLRAGGAEVRQAELRDWGMDPLTFVSWDGTRALKDGGEGVLVTEANRKEYAQLLCEDFLIGNVRTELGALVMGFHEVVPKELLKDLDAEQLRMLVCGVAELDVDDWQAHAIIEGPKPKKVARWFFDWLRKRPAETRSKMLAFATGSSVLPSGWDGLRDQQGQPLPFRILVQGAEEALPSAHTCANLLVLPPVVSRALLEWRLDQVVELAGREMFLV